MACKRPITIKLPSWMAEEIDKLIQKGIFISRAEFVRYAIRTFLKELLKKNKISYEDIKPVLEKYNKEF